MPRLELVSGDVCRIGPVGCAGWVLPDVQNIGITVLAVKKCAVCVTGAVAAIPPVPATTAEDDVAGNKGDVRAAHRLPAGRAHRPGRPTSCNPIGSPWTVSATGRAMARSPLTFAKDVNGVNCTYFAKLCSVSSASYRPRAGCYCQGRRDHGVEPTELADDRALESRERTERGRQFAHRHLPPAQYEPLGERLDQVKLLIFCGDARRARLPESAEVGDIGGIRFEGELLDSVPDRVALRQREVQCGGCFGRDRDRDLVRVTLRRGRHDTQLEPTLSAHRGVEHGSAVPALTALTEIPQFCSLKFPTPGRFRS